MLEGQWLADMWGRPSSLGACKTAARRMPDLICFKIQGCIFGRKSVSSANVETDYQFFIQRHTKGCVFVCMLLYNFVMLFVILAGGVVG